MFVRSLPYWKVLGVALLCLAVEPVMGQAQAAAKKPPPACKGSSRVGWNNCVGTYTTTEGALYVGEFRNGKYNGQGTATWPNGDRYIGEFRDDKFHGRASIRRKRTSPMPATFATACSTASERTPAPTA